MPFAFALFLPFQPSGSFVPIPRGKKPNPGGLPLCPPQRNRHPPAPREQKPRRSEKFGNRAPSFTSAAALEAQGAGEGTHGRVEGVAHGRGLAGRGIRLAAVAVGFAGLLVHPQGRQRELLPNGARGDVGQQPAFRGRGALAARGPDTEKGGVGKQPLPLLPPAIARVPKALGEGVVIDFQLGDLRGKREKGGGVKPCPISPPPHPPRPPSGSPGCAGQAAKRAAAPL